MKVIETGKVTTKPDPEDESEHQIPDRIELIAENDEEETLLAFIRELNKKDGFVPLVDLMVDLINKDVLVRYDGRWVWDDKFIIEDDNPMYH